MSGLPTGSVEAEAWKQFAAWKQHATTATERAEQYTSVFRTLRLDAKERLVRHFLPLCTSDGKLHCSNKTSAHSEFFAVHAGWWPHTKTSVVVALSEWAGLRGDARCKQWRVLACQLVAAKGAQTAPAAPQLATAKAAVGGGLSAQASLEALQQLIAGKENAAAPLAPLAQPSVAVAEAAAFVASPRFAGAKRGYYFSCGKQGVGYYSHAKAEPASPAAPLQVVPGASPLPVQPRAPLCLFQLAGTDAEGGQVHLVAEACARVGCDVNERCGSRRLTPLLVAAARGALRCCAALLEQGADVHAADDKGLTALHLSVRAADVALQLRLCELLLQFGASPEARDGEGRTPGEHPACCEEARLMLCSHSRSRSREHRDDDDEEGARALKRFKAPPPDLQAEPLAPALPSLVTVADACAFLAAAGVRCTGGTLACAQAAVEREEVDGEALLSMTEAELDQVLGLDHWASRRRLFLALRDAQHTQEQPDCPPRPMPASPQRVAAWLRSELGGAAGAAAAEVVVREGVDARLLQSLSDAEIPTLFFCDGDGAIHAALAAAIAPLRAAAQAGREGGPAAPLPWGYLPSLPLRDDPAVYVLLGDTGAGKSTLINAILGTRQLLPTSGMRACTAAIVELTFNAGPRTSCDAGPQAAGGLYANGQSYSPFVCAVEFLSREEWRAEVELLCSTLKRGADGRLLEPDGDSPAAEAWWKIRTAYGRVDSPQDLQADTSLDGFLGTVRRFQGATADELHAQIAPFVDSTAGGGCGATGATGGQLWPLVRRVRCAGPWASLACGACLVDAPGVQDDNSARDKVVQAYLRNADGVWLVSNIRRAVNDKTAREHLLATYRHALATGGRYGQLAFVATQTDVLEASEVADNLRLGDHQGPPTKQRSAAARNEYTKQRLEREFWGSLVGMDHPTPAAAQSSCATRQVVLAAPPPPTQPDEEDLLNWLRWPSRALRDVSKPAAWLPQGWRPAQGSRGIVVHEWPAQPAKPAKPAKLRMCVAMVVVKEGNQSIKQERRLPAKPALPAVPARPPCCLVQFGGNLVAMRADALAAPEAPFHTAAGAAAQQQQGSQSSRFQFQFPVFTASAVECQKLAGLRPHDGEAAVFADADATEVPALRAFLRDAVAATRAAAAAAAAAAEAPSSAPALRDEAATSPEAGAMRLQIALHAEERALSAELEAVHREAAALGISPEPLYLQLLTQDMARVRAASHKLVAASAPAPPQQQPGAAANGRVRSGALMLRCLEEAKEEAAKAEEAAEAEHAWVCAPWTCACLHVNSPQRGAGSAAPADCLRCEASRPAHASSTRGRGGPHCSGIGKGPFWTCTRVACAGEAFPLMLDGTPRCGFFNTGSDASAQHPYAAVTCAQCARPRLPCASVPPGPDCAALTSSAATTQQLLTWGTGQLCAVLHRRRHSHALLMPSASFVLTGNQRIEMHARRTACGAQGMPPLMPALFVAADGVAGSAAAAGPGPAPPPIAAKFSKAQEPLPSPAEFIPGGYTRLKPGYVHRNGRLGIGYYRDSEYTRSSMQAMPKQYVEDADGCIDLTMDDD